MQRGIIILDDGHGAVRRESVGSGIVVGRSKACEFPIDDEAASRKHLEVLARAGEHWCRDLGSTNGTLLNGAPVGESALRPGDVMQIGQTLLRFELEEIPDPDESPTDEVFHKTILDASGAVEESSRPGGRTERLLRAAYSVMKELAADFDTCVLAERILDTTMTAISAQRGAVLFAGPDDTLLPCPECGDVHMIENGSLRHAGPEEIRISRTVVHRVLQGNESVLYRDTAEPGELALSESIMALDLRSIICVPLRGKYGALGVLYIDSNRPDATYDDDDMLLSSVVGHSAGLALENAGMHRQILEKQRIQQEIEHAWDIQQGFLVKEWPTGKGRYDVFGDTRPAKTVGGDFFDFIAHGSAHVGILIGDVSGKGVPAALTMAQVLAQFRVEARETASPAAVLAALNDELVRRSRHGGFCTVCYLSLDLDAGRVRCANAGHLPALRIGADTVQLARPSGPPIGILEEARWQDEEFDVQPGEAFLLFTDGVVEARPDAPDAAAEYGFERLQAAANQAAQCSMRELVAHVAADVARFCAPCDPHDDCTMIALRYAP